MFRRKSKKKSEPVRETDEARSTRVFVAMCKALESHDLETIRLYRRKGDLYPDSHFYIGIDTCSAFTYACQYKNPNSQEFSDVIHYLFKYDLHDQHTGDPNYLFFYIYKNFGMTDVSLSQIDREKYTKIAARCILTVNKHKTPRWDVSIIVSSYPDYDSTIEDYINYFDYLRGIFSYHGLVVGKDAIFDCDGFYKFLRAEVGLNISSCYPEHSYKELRQLIEYCLQNSVANKHLKSVMNESLEKFKTALWVNLLNSELTSETLDDIKVILSYLKISHIFPKGESSVYSAAYDMPEADKNPRFKYAESVNRAVRWLKSQNVTVDMALLVGALRSRIAFLNKSTCVVVSETHELGDMSMTTRRSIVKSPRSLASDHQDIRDCEKLIARFIK